MISASKRQSLLAVLSFEKVAGWVASGKFPLFHLPLCQRRDKIYSFESPGSTFKQLAFSEFCGASYTTEVSDKFTEYLKLCYRTCLCLDTGIHLFISHPTAKEKRQRYTLGPILEETDAPPEASGATATPPHYPRPPHTTGPERTKRTSVARMRTGPLPAHLKAKVLANIAKAKKTHVATAHNAPTTDTPLVMTPQMGASQGRSNPSIIGTSTPAELNTSDATNPLSATVVSIPDNYTPSNRSHTSSLPDDFNMDVDDLEPNPWTAIDHFTGEVIIGDDNDLVIPAPTAPQTDVETGILPRLGIHAILETDPPTLLFEDEEVRPDWLVLAVRKFLRYIPYYGRLSKVVDLFLAQEARLGYPDLVIYLHSPRCIPMLTTSSLFVLLFRPRTGPLKWPSSRSGHGITRAVITWTPRYLVRLLSSGGSPSSQPCGSNGLRPMIHSQVTSRSTTSIAGDPTACF